MSSLSEQRCNFKSKGEHKPNYIRSISQNQHLLEWYLTMNKYTVMKGTSLNSEHTVNVSCFATRSKATENVNLIPQRIDDDNKMKIISQRIDDEDDDDLDKFNAASKGKLY